MDWLQDARGPYEFSYSDGAREWVELPSGKRVHPAPHTEQELERWFNEGRSHEKPWTSVRLGSGWMYTAASEHVARHPVGSRKELAALDLGVDDRSVTLVSAEGGVVVTSTADDSLRVFELADDDLSVRGDITVRRAEGAGDMWAAETVAGPNAVYVATVVPGGMKMSEYSRPHLQLTREFFIPFEGATHIEYGGRPLQGVVAISPDGNWVALHRDTLGSDEMKLFSTVGWEVATTVKGFDPRATFKHGLMLVHSGCICEGEDNRELEIVLLADPAKRSRLALADYGTLLNGPDALWGVTADALELHRFTYEAPGQREVRSLVAADGSAAYQSAPPWQLGTFPCAFQADEHDVFVWPADGQSDARARFLTANWVNGRLTSYRIDEQGSELLIDQQVKDVVFLRLFPDDGFLVVVSRSGDIRRVRFGASAE